MTGIALLLATLICESALSKYRQKKRALKSQKLSANAVFTTLMQDFCVSVIIEFLLIIRVFFSISENAYVC
jgi:O-antigen/teichoic acid export membrane protein